MNTALKRTVRIAGVSAGALLLLIAAALAVLVFDKPLVKRALLGRMAKRTGMTLRAGRLDYGFFPFRVVLDDLEIEQETPVYQMSLSVGRVSAAGDLPGVAKGRPGALEAVEIERLIIRAGLKAEASAPIDFDALARQASEALFLVKRISATECRLSIAQGSRTASLKGASLTLVPKDGREVVYSLATPSIEVRDAARDAELASEMTSSGVLRFSPAFSVQGTLALRSPRVREKGENGSFEEAAFELEGMVDLSRRRFEVPRFTLSVPGLLSLRGNAGGDVGKAFIVDSELAGSIDSLGALAPHLRDRIPARYRGFRLGGRAKIEGRVHLEGSNGANRGRWTGSLTLEQLDLTTPEALLRGALAVSGRCGLGPADDGAGVVLDAELALDRGKFEGAAHGLPFRLGLAGRASAKGAPGDPRIAADLRMTTGRLGGERLHAGAADIRVLVEATKKGVSVPRVLASLDRIALVPAPGKAISFDRLEVEAKGRIDLLKRSGSFEAGLTGLQDIPPVRLTGTVGLGDRPEAQARLEAKGIDIPAARALAAPLLTAALAEWEIAGTADASLEAAGPDAKTRGWRISGEVSLSDVKLNDPGFTVAGESLSPSLAFHGSWAPLLGVEAEATLELERGQTLWRTVFVPWDSHPLAASFRGRYDPATGIGSGLAARISVPTIGTLDLSGSVRTRPEPDLDLEAGARLSLAPLRALTAQEGSETSNRMRISGILGGKLRARMAGKRFSGSGRLSLSETDVELVPSGTRLTGITADVPVLFDSDAGSGPSAGAALPESGLLTVAEVSHPLLSLRSLSIPLRSGTNALGIGTVGADLFGGRLELGRALLSLDPRTGAFEGAGSLAVRDLDIAKVPIPSPQFKLTGRARADFPLIRISPHEIAFSGQGEIGIFGGRIVVRNLSVAEPFAPGRAFSLDADLVDLDLKKLTDEVPFGEVTGIVRGEVRGLVLSYGQPARFDLRIESVPRRGVPRTFSLKAVDNLTVLSSGTQASAGTGPFWMRFIRGFRYDRLGIVSTLRNDTFTLNGTIREGGVEYLVKKPPLFGINVVNRMPDKRISFKEMTSRLKRVGQSEARPGEAGRRQP